MHHSKIKYTTGTVSARTEADGPTLVLRIRDVLSDKEWIVLEKGRQRIRRRRRSTKLQLQKELGVRGVRVVFERFSQIL